ncbi:MAG: rod shape-determining protein MreD [Planctomycetes bacterium]|nr:rod shape-determining protein MreD [Planctomycetota bacterium]
MIYPAAIISALLAVLLHTTASPLYRLQDAAPDFVLLVVGHVCLFGSRRQAMLAAFLAGILCDVASLDPWPIHTARLLLAAHFLALGKAEGWAERLLPRAILFAAVAALSAAVHASLLWTLSDIDPGLASLSLSVLYTAAISLPGWHLLRSVAWIVPEPSGRAETWRL